MAETPGKNCNIQLNVTKECIAETKHHAQNNALNAWNVKDRLFQLNYHQIRELLARLDRVDIPALPFLVTSNSLLHMHQVAMLVHSQQAVRAPNLMALDRRTQAAPRPLDPTSSSSNCALASAITSCQNKQQSS